ncbi:MAG TPA: hypothetical protein VNM92_03615 [Thermoanaerobaculia bacterium]|nr:hypothetical protein [Thermoanaerobaculia bacterium]
MKHYSEADLLELHYGGERDPAAQHMSECSECTRRFVSVRLKLLSARSSACASVDTKPSTFWARQRVAITRAIDAKHVLPERRLRTAPKLAFAAALIAVLSLGVVRVANRPADTPESKNVAISASRELTNGPGSAAVGEIASLTATQDPWETAELEQFREVVEWESWIEADQRPEGTL